MSKSQIAITLLNFFINKHLFEFTNILIIDSLKHITLMLAHLIVFQ